MKTEIAQKWVEALRSGKYLQAQSALRDKNGYCCLGVLCDLAAQDGVGDWGTVQPGEKAEDYDINDFVFLGDTETLPEQVRDWAGMKTESGDISTMPNPNYPYDPDIVMNLTNFNDGWQKFEGEKNEHGAQIFVTVPPMDFKQIADVIEKNAEIL